MNKPLCWIKLINLYLLSNAYPSIKMYIIELKLKALPGKLLFFRYRAFQMLVSLWRGEVRSRKTHTECRHRVAFDIRNKLTYKSDLHPSQVADLMGIRFTPKKANRNWLFLNGFWAFILKQSFKSYEFSDPESKIQKMMANVVTMFACWYFFLQQ